MHNPIPRSVFRSLSICFFLLHIHATVAQETSNTIVAKTGDGIFSVLRKSGIHPINYYEQFLKLNADNIKNGSELIVGKEYILPDAPDSFKRTGVRIDTGEEVEAPIFNETELSLMNQKDTTLQNTVYYFVHSGGTESKKRFDSLTRQLANDLMVKGARVYLLEDSKIAAAISDSLSLVAKKEMYGNFSSAINKKYLRHKGAYQRVILIEDAFGPRENSVVRISHNPKSREGRQFASVLENVLRKNTSVPVKEKNEPNSFKDDASLYFANNLVPPIVILNFTDGSKPLQGGFNLKSEKKPLVGLLNDGILEDYSQLNFEN
ncbi:hypothetical protein [Maribacter aurantiacus]|uniref:LysM domain-containing protein n=1 Tax=Maribacter aurantiacus TaxID=1882343 RepID=A0A5R8MBI7_9FLAO|nr:hypothetical protein [Maribacter aurantiacus]TLF46913.1 hypothetical protein FEK29_03845 [Maribacter aurantiacus]